MACLSGLPEKRKPRSSSDTGYVIQQPGSTISGLKLNSSSLARFHFGKRQDSYASLMGKPKGIGKIAVTHYADAIPPVEGPPLAVEKPWAKVRRESLEANRFWPRVSADILDKQPAARGRVPTSRHCLSGSNAGTLVFSWQ